MGVEQEKINSPLGPNHDATTELLSILNPPSDLQDLIKKVTAYLQKWTGCEAVGVRLKQGEDYPYFETRGFPPQFVEAEKNLCTRDIQGQVLHDRSGNPVLECMCGNVLCGRFNPAFSFFTSKGSFWSNCTTDLLATTTDADRQARTRNRCNGEGYESVGLFRMQVGNETLGLLQVNDRQKGRFTPSLLSFLEFTADQIAIAISQRKTLAALSKSEQLYRSLFNNMLNGFAYCEMIFNENRPWDFTYLAVNDSFEKHTGLKNVVGKNASEVIPGIRELDPGLLERYGRVASGGPPETFEIFVAALKMWFSISVYCPKNGFFVALFDVINARKEAENQLQESNRRFAQTADTVPGMLFDYIMHKDGHDQMLYVNPKRCRDIFELDAEDVRHDSLTIWKLVHPEDLGALQQTVIKAIQSGQEFRAETRIITSSGILKWIELASRQTATTIGEAHVWSGIMLDITDRKKAEIALKFRNVLLATQQEASIEGILVVDENARILSFNRRFVEMWNLPTKLVNDKLDAPLLQFNVDQVADAPSFVAKVKSLYEHKNESCQDEILLKDGRTFDRYSAPLLGPEGEYFGRIWYFRDISDRKKVEKAITEKDQLLSDISDMASVGGWEFDPEANRFFWSAECARIHDAPPNSMVTIQDAIDSYQGEYRLKKENAIQEAVQFGKPYDLELEMVTLKGNRKWVRTIGFPIKEGDRVVKVRGALQDITQYKKAREALELSQNKMAEALDIAKAGHWEFDVASREFTFNERFFALFGTSAEREGGFKMSGENYAKNFVHPDDASMVIGVIKKSLEERNPQKNIDLEHRIVRRDGQVRDISVRITFIKDSEGHVVGTRGVNQDITERKNELKILELSQRQMSEAMDLAKAAHMDFNHNMRKFIFTDQFYHLLCTTAEREGGYEMSPEDFVSRFIHPDDVGIVVAGLRKAEEAVSRSTLIELEHRVIRRDGQTMVVSVIVTIKKDSEGHIIEDHGVMQDITERKLAEAERQRLATAIGQAAEVIVVTDHEGTIQYVNPAFEAVTGYTQAEAIGRNPRILKSGIQDEEFYKRMWETISLGSIWRGRLVNKKKDGSIFTEDATISPVRDIAGNIVNYVAVKRDITEILKLQEENEKIQAQFLQSQKMESVGRLAGGVAHDFNNMLNVITGHSEMVLRSMDQTNPLWEDLQEIRNAALRSADLTRQLLTFARKQIVSPQILDINSSAESTLKMLRRLIGEHIELNWRPDHDVWPIKMDPTQLNQVLANLSVNARDAITGAGSIFIHTENVVLQTLSNSKQANFVPGDYVLLQVRDSGSGMSPEVVSHAFEPFFTTKEAGKGTGLGLATVFGIVEQNNGWIALESEVGKGTTFNIYFPRNAGLVATESDGGTTASSLGAGERILLVEDEKALLAMGKQILEELGYVVLTAQKPSEALEKIMSDTGKIDLLISDIIMPEMTGKNMADQICAKRPGTKKLFMSGYTADVLGQAESPEEKLNFIQKPFTIDDLAQKVRTILDRP